jgi:hypothetical protein
VDSIAQREARQQGALADGARVAVSAFPTLEDEIACCTDKWAVRHCFVNDQTGEVVPVLCHTYGCKRCGPLRVEAWRSFIELAEPERFITLSRVGLTLVEVGRVATVLARRLRRKGYTFEYCMTFERHRNGYYHIHMLQKGDYIPQPLLSDCLLTATHGFSYVVHIAKCTPGTAGYVTKYCTKVLAAQEVQRSDGTRARVNRVRYSKGFFPAPTKVLKVAFREAAAEKRGEVLEDDGGMWKLLEMAPVPRDERGRVIEALAHEQYRQLVERRVKEASNEPLKLSKGGKRVLAYMVLESLQRGDITMPVEQADDTQVSVVGE